MATTTQKDKKRAVSGNVAKFLYWTSIIALCLVLIASVKHVQVTYLSIESVETQKSDEISWPPWTMAIGLELTLVISAYILAIKRRKKEKPERIYSVGIWGATILNFAGNMYFSLVTKVGNMDLTTADLEAVDSFILFRMFLISGTVCLISLLLLEYISFFYVQIKSEEVAEKVQLEKERKKEESKTLREKRLAYREQVSARSKGVDLDFENAVEGNSGNVEIFTHTPPSKKEKTVVEKPQRTIKPESQKIPKPAESIDAEPELVEEELEKKKKT